MLALNNIFFSVLLLTVAAKGDGTTVTLFDDVGTDTTTRLPSLIGISTMDVEPNGGTAYVEKVEFTTTLSGSPVTTTQTATIVEAASWQYMSVQATSGPVTDNIQQNCTLETNNTKAECVEIIGATEFGMSTTTTATLSAQVTPLATLTVTKPIPTKSSAATIPDNPMSNKPPRFFWAFWGILFVFF